MQTSKRLSLTLGATLFGLSSLASPVAADDSNLENQESGEVEVLPLSNAELVAALVGLSMYTSPVSENGFSLDLQAKGGIKGPPSGKGDEEEDPPSYYDWMHVEIQGAWDAEFLGQGTTITVVDDFSSNMVFEGKLGEQFETLRHGEWTLKEASMIAPAAKMREDEFTVSGKIRLKKGFNVLNLSYGMYAETGYDVDNILWSPQEASILSFAESGEAVVSKAAGNDSVAVGTATTEGLEDYLATALICAQSAIFVGALDSNGGSLAAYSNIAGTNVDVQNQFLVVGVDAEAMGGLAGTSFAAPIISGYAAVLASKFPDATPTQVANQLLSTARQDTINSYSVEIHGQGEASIANALAPVCLE